MNVYSYLDPYGSDLDFQLIPIWEESWRAQGWTPRLLTIRDAKKHPGFNPLCSELFAFSKVGGGWYSSPWIINISFLPQQRRVKLETFVGGVTWATRRGAKEWATSFPRNLPSLKIGNPIIGENLPLITCARCQSIEEVRKQIEQCSLAKK